METFTASQIIEITERTDAGFSINEHGEGIPLEAGETAGFCRLVTELLGPAIACVASPFRELKHVKVIHPIPPMGRDPQSAKPNPHIQQFLGPDFQCGGSFIVASAKLAEAAFAV